MLKQYAAEKRVDWLAAVLPEILTTDEHRQLISSIRYESEAFTHGTARHGGDNCVGRESRED